MKTPLSTDYRALFDSVMKGNRHLGQYISNNGIIGTPVVVIKYSETNGLWIGGHGFCDAYSNENFPEFEQACKSINLEFVP